MKKVVVIGSGGSGKSTFSRRLGEATGLPVIHLDSHFWRPKWERTPVDEWEQQVSKMVCGDLWIMDGNFGGTRLIRLRACDTVILLDISRYTCLYRVLKRAIKYRGRSRPDMAEGCSEKLDLEFLSWVWNYPKRGRKRALAEMNQLPEKRFVVLKTDQQKEIFLHNAAIGAERDRNGSQA